jgi:hypothetical protein
MAGTLLSILANLGPALTGPEIGQIKARLFSIANLDQIPGPTMADLQARQEQERIDGMFGAAEEVPYEAPKLEVVDEIPEDIKPA